VETQYWNGSGWEDAFGWTNSGVAGWNKVDFPDVTTDKIRIWVRPPAGKKCQLDEFECYGNYDFSNPPAIAGENLIPTTPGKAPNYFCTWNVQGYIVSYKSSKDERDAMNGSNMFGTGKYQNCCQ